MRYRHSRQPGIIESKQSILFGADPERAKLVCKQYSHARSSKLRVQIGTFVQLAFGIESMHMVARANPKSAVCSRSKTNSDILEIKSCFESAFFEGADAPILGKPYLALTVSSQRTSGRS